MSGTNKQIVFIIIVFSLLTLQQCNRKAIQPESQPSVSHKSPFKPAAATASYKGENFEKFYDRFHTDSAFQVKRTQFPLKGKAINFKGAKSWEKTSWKMIKGKATEVNPKEFNIKTTKKADSYFEGIYCKNCGFSFEMEFLLIDGKWYLVYLQENDL